MGIGDWGLGIVCGNKKQPPDPTTGRPRKPSGRFDAVLLSQINRASDVILILSPGTLDRCSEENDWARIELTHARTKGKNIVPLRVDGFSWPQEPLPFDLADLPFLHGVTVTHEVFDLAVDRLTRMLRARPHMLRAPVKRSLAKWLVIVAASTVLVLASWNILYKLGAVEFSPTEWLCWYIWYRFSSLRISWT